ncbi:tetratricopeptide repeat protein [Streptomyces sp. NBC_01618]|uniref:tetratricopeptide repeat protein n=1 Tax=Streptomyces sp. NBC_01618 TaxID=2975900 RepID=UPI0038645FC8|nr:tetratricopeptide repeat protein [Streptomyces sp. NBC_01618]
MDEHRVVRIHVRHRDGRTRTGSGYLVAPRLVLTAAHLLAEGAEPMVAVPSDLSAQPDAPTAPGPAAPPIPAAPSATDAPAFTATPACTEWPAPPVWSRLDDTVDAALLHITAAAWRPPPCSHGSGDFRIQRWGRLVTDTTGHTVSCVGHPRMQRDASGNGVEQLSATVNPLTGRAKGRYELLGTASTFGGPGGDTPHDGVSPWSGMSGAAVFSGPLLLGVVRHDRGARTGARLSATRSHELLRDDAFVRTLTAHTGLRPEAEAADLAALLSPAPPQRALVSPATLLRADVEAVSFRGRTDQREELRAWCEAPARQLAVQVLVAPGGQGKTRLARWLVTTMRSLGWAAGFIRSELPDTAAALLPHIGGFARIQHPALFVVDYAESRPNLIRELIRQSLECAHPVRVLLLSRSIGTWKTEARDAPAAVHELLDLAPFTLLPALDDSVVDRDSAFVQAAKDLAELLGQVPDHHGVDWPAVARSVAPPPTADRPVFEAALTIQMGALLALLRHDRAQSAPATEPLPMALLRHEKRYWVRSAAAVGIPLGEADLSRAVTAATLCGASGPAEAVATAGRIPGIPSGLRSRVADWLRALYPSPQSTLYWGQLHPDRIAEYHASRTLIETDGLLTALFRDGSPEQQIRTLDVLTRAVVGHANAGRSTMAEQLLSQLNGTLDEVRVAAPVFRACAAALPDSSHVLGPLALRIARMLLDRYATEPGTPATVLAWAYRNLATRSLDMADEPTALAAGSKAVELCLGPVEDEPGDHEADLAHALYLYAMTLSDDDLEGQFRAAHHALRLRLRLAAQDPAPHRRDLIQSERQVASVLWRMDRREESDEHTRRAGEESERLNEEQPGRHQDLLAYSLRDLSVGHWHDEEYDQAIAADEQSVALLRRLTATNRDGFATRLAHSLQSLFVTYNTAGRLAEAMAVADEVLGILEPLAAERPAVHKAAFAEVLHNLSFVQEDLGDGVAALETVRRAASLREELLAASPRRRRRTALAGSFVRIAYLLRTEERWDEALDFTSRALELRRLVPNPLGQERARTADTLSDLGWTLSRVGRYPEAITALRECVALQRVLVQEAVGVPRKHDEREGGLIYALAELAHAYSRDDRTAAERILLREALVLLRRRHRADPDNWAESLARCLSLLGEDPTDVRQVIPLLEEAVDLYADMLGAGGGEAARDGLLAALARLRNAQSTAGRHRAAVRTGLRLLETAARAEARPAAYRATDHTRLASAYARTGAYTEARAHSRRAVALCRAALAEGACGLGDLAWHLLEQAQILDRGDFGGNWHATAAALVPARESLALHRYLARSDPAGYTTAQREAVTVVAGILLRLGRVAESEAVRHRHAA